MSNRLRALTALLTASLLFVPASAQVAPGIAQRNQNSASTTPRVDSVVFTKTRSATIRIEGRDADDDVAGTGTGFFISSDGLALTAYHVVFRQRGEEAITLKAVTTDRKEYALEVLAFDDYNDIALLRVKVPGPVPFLPLAQSAPRVGDPILAIGNGNGAFLTAKYGNLRALDVEAGRLDFPSGTLEMTAPLVPGDSGGPIINAAGEAVGVTSYIRGVGPGTWRSYAVPVTEASALVRDLRSGVKRDAPVLGIGWIGFDLRDEAYAELGLGKRPGVIVATVTEDGPAARAGLRARSGNTLETLKADVIVEVAGKATPTWEDLINAVRSQKIGDTVPVVVQRGDQTVTLSLRLGARAELFGVR